MPKHIEDIVVSKRKKSIRDIPIPENRRRSSVDRRGEEEVERRKTPRRTSDVREREEVEEVVMPRINSYKPETRTRRKKKMPRRKVFFSLMVTCALLIFAGMVAFGGATLTYTPKSANLAFAGENFSAYKTASGGVVFSVVKLSGEKSKSVPATGEERVERSASGTIVVYNNAGTSPQPLVATTRFETPDGKVYRIDKDISVPGRKTVGGDIQPGAIEVTVYADEPGADYNIELSDFTLPGLKGTSKYSTIYARSKTPMSGGFVGQAKSVSESDLASAETQLKTELKAELSNQAEAQVPSDFILFPSLSETTFEKLPQSEAEGNNVTLNMRGNFYGVMFKRSDLAHFLGAEKTDIPEGDVVDIPNVRDLVFSFDGAPPLDLLTTNKIAFTVTGDALLVWKTNEETLKSDLVGLSKNQLSSVLANYPSIVNADAVVRPFWKSVFPDKVEDISIKRASVQ